MITYSTIFCVSLIILVSHDLWLKFCLKLLKVLLKSFVSVNQCNALSQNISSMSQKSLHHDQNVSYFVSVSCLSQLYFCKLNLKRLRFLYDSCVLSGLIEFRYPTITSLHRVPLSMLLPSPTGQAWNYLSESLYACPQFWHLPVPYRLCTYTPWRRQSLEKFRKFVFW